jgi:CheY-like chemotaxis protein
MEFAGNRVGQGSGRHPEHFRENGRFSSRNSMPGLDGFGIADAVRHHPGGQGVRIVALTASGMRGDRERALASGFDGYLTRPISVADLRGAVLEWLYKIQV